MIYELMKFEPGWKYLPWYVLGSAVICALPAPVSEFGVMAVMMGMFVAFPHLHATRFNASLPIAGRDLQLERALFLMSMVWLPAMAGAAAAIFSGHSVVATRALIVAALCTLAAGAAQSTRVRELAAPKWIFFAPWIFVPITGMYLERHSANGLIPASCALAGFALLARTWSVVPKSFELAPAKPEAGDGGARLASPVRVTSPRFVWLPVLRSVFTARYLSMAGLLVFFALGSQTLALCWWILILWVMARQNTLWLRPLPVRPRPLLIATLAPMLLALALGCIGGFATHPKTVPALPVRILDLGALLGWALAVALGIELVDWRRLSHIPVRVRHSLGAVLMAAAFVGGLAFGPRGVDPLHVAVSRLAAALPNSAGVAIALTAAVLGALWLALEKVFAEADCTGKPRMQKDEYFG